MNSLSSIPASSIIIAPTYLHPYLRSELLQNKNGLLDLQILSFNSWLHSLQNTTNPAMETIIFEYYQMLTQAKNKWPTYGHMFSSLSFLEECYQFIKACKQFNIKASDLPETSVAQKEMKLIIEELMPVQLAIDEEKAIFQAVCNQEDLCSHLYIIDTYFDIYDKQCIDALVNRGATLVETDRITPQIEFYHSTNMRQEIEACAQYIIQHKCLSEDVCITLADLEYQPFLEQIFDRYQIPYTLLFHNRASSIVMQMKYLIAYYIEPTNSSLLTLLESDVFKVPCLKQLCTYIRIFEKDIHDDFNHIERAIISEDIINKIELDQLRKLEEQANIAKQAIIETLDQVLSCESNEVILKTSYEIVSASLSINQQNVDTCYALQTLMQHTLPYLNDKAALKLFLSLLETITQSDQNNSLQGCVVTNLTHPFLTRPYHFVLGCSQSNFPAFPKPSSLFSQDYLDQIPYPLHKDRYYLHTHQLYKFLSSSKQVILSYSQSDFNGKGMQAALEIERFVNRKAIKYPFITHCLTKPFEPNLSSTMAQSLYRKDHQLKGSISAFERYVGCHFSYYLRYALSIKEPLDYAFSNAKLGTLSHFVLEYFVNQYKKDYVKVTYDEVYALLHLKLMEMQQIYPNMEAAFKLIEMRLMDSIMNTLKDLKDMEEHTAFVPFQCEYAFEQIIPIDSDTELRLNGYIDRIDQYVDTIRIIDYKSSHKTLSETSVAKANQLQLLTYAMIAQKHFNKSCAGVYYQSLKSENIQAIAGKMNRRAKLFVPYNQEDYQRLSKNAQRLNGWHMSEELSAIDDDATHFTGLSMNKDGIVNARKLYDMDAIEEQLLIAYQSIAKQILTGDIAINPDSNACTFCKYHDICRNHKLPIDKPILIDIENIYLKGGGSHDDVE
ncbi:MAG: PD-(D/E)XK nuclease family protein [Erysipelotrichaceae bacterium]